MTLHRLEKLHRLYDGYCQSFLIGGQSVLLMQVEGRHFILENRCPHMDAPLYGGSIHAGAIRCPLHGLCFQLEDGLPAPPTPSAVGRVKTFAPQYDGTDICIEI